VPKDLIFSFPCTTHNGKISVVEGINMDDEITQQRMKKTVDELVEERNAVEHLLK
jgi:malate/lactate dehydrogenase